MFSGPLRYIFNENLHTCNLYKESLFKTLNKIMPQLVPFFFVNEITFTFAIIALTVYLLSKFILPRFVRLFLSRTFILKVLDK